MFIKGVERAKYYELQELANAARMPLEEIRNLVEHGDLESHYTDNELYVNGKDFLIWAEKQKDEPRHPQEQQPLTQGKEANDRV